MSRLDHRTILLVISGGIAAYKALDLIRLLDKAGAKVRCVMTKGAEAFITPLSVGALSKGPVFTDLFSLKDEQSISHIQLARTCDLVVVAPATANRIAKLAHGIADDLASTILLATDKPILLAPAMNCMMWRNAATQDNMALLQKRGITSVGPDSGMLACGEEGEGRMSTPDAIFEAIVARLSSNLPLSGKRVLVTSGPTYESIDPVRFIGNRSSGKMGQAIAEALAKAGAETILVTGPTFLPPPPNVKTVRIETAREMLAACEAEENLDAVICAAAVADWRPDTEASQKIKKDGSVPTFALTENPDILATLARPSPKRAKLVIGFAAETQNCVEAAKAKFERKGCDWLLANEVGNGKAFGAETNQVTLLARDATGALMEDVWPSLPKTEIAARLAAAIAHQLTAQKDR